MKQADYQKHIDAQPNLLKSDEDAARESERVSERERQRQRERDTDRQTKRFTDTK